MKYISVLHLRPAFKFYNDGYLEANLGHSFTLVERHSVMNECLFVCFIELSIALDGE